jgi:hypothetical protein
MDMKEYALLGVAAWASFLVVLGRGLLGMDLKSYSPVTLFFFFALGPKVGDGILVRLILLPSGVVLLGLLSLRLPDSGVLRVKEEGWGKYE